jgi:glycosyltransferase 2 family protein
VRRIGILLSLVGTLTLAVLTVNSGDWQEPIQPLLTAQVEWLVAALVVALSVEIVKTLRWQLLLGVEPERLSGLLALVLTARLLNALAPLRTGDIWRIGSVARAERRHLLTAGGSVFAEKVLDGVALGSLSVAALGSADSAPLPLLVAAGLLVGWGLALAAGRWSDGRAGLGRWTAELRHLRSFRVLAGAAVLTAAGVGLGLLVNLLVLRALSLPSGVMIGLIMLLAGYAVGAVPAGPGALGVFELAVATPLMAVGLTPAASVAAALTLHLVLLATVGVGGLLAVPLGWWEQHSTSSAIST